MARTSRPPVVPARGTGRARWRILTPAKLAAHLLATPQISDAAWTSELRLPREARADFVCRVLGVPRPRAARQVYPACGFERHAGYITSAHSAAVVEYGPSPIHRLSYRARCYQQRLFDDPS